MVHVVYGEAPSSFTCKSPLVHFSYSIRPGRKSASKNMNILKSHFMVENKVVCLYSDQINKTLTLVL